MKPLQHLSVLLLFLVSTATLAYAQEANGQSPARESLNGGDRNECADCTLSLSNLYAQCKSAQGGNEDHSCVEKILAKAEECKESCYRAGMLTNDDAQKLDSLQTQLKEQLNAPPASGEPTPGIDASQKAEPQHVTREKSPAQSDYRRCECNGSIILTNVACPCN